MKTASIKFSSISEYLSSIPAHAKERFEELRTVIKQTAPDAEELISYNMPAIKMNGMLVWYAAYMHHIGFYPSASPILFFKNELANYKTSKGAIQFPLEKRIPKALVIKIVKFRIRENIEKAKNKKK